MKTRMILLAGLALMCLTLFGNVHSAKAASWGFSVSPYGLGVNVAPGYGYPYPGYYYPYGYSYPYYGYYGYPYRYGYAYPYRRGRDWDDYGHHRWGRGYGREWREHHRG